MRSLTLAAIILCWPAPVLAAQVKDKSAPTPAKQQFDALAKEYQDGVSAFQQAYLAAKTAEEKKAATDKFPKREEFATRMAKIAEAHPSDAAAVDVLVWIVLNAGYTPEGDKALGVLTEKHAASEKVGDLYLSLTYSQSANAEKLLRRIIRENPNRVAKGKAHFGLARRLSEPGNAAADREADQLFEEVEKNYADIPYFRPGMTLGQVARQARHLLIGKEAPEIEGEDLDGQKFKLSDYRGKVVVLDFWGHW